MASVKDLEIVFGQEERLTPGAVRQLTRLLQDGGILPKAKRGASRGPLPELTAYHCAAWLVGLAVTRRAGLRRNVDAAAARVKRFLELVQWMGDGRCFGDVLEEHIEMHISGGIWPGFTPDRITFLNDDTLPRVEILMRGDPREDKGYQVLSFVTPEEKREASERYPKLGHTDFTDAFIIDATVLSRFHEVFNRASTPAEAVESTA